ncbi:response regulator [Sphingomonas aurantiaca]|uniref:response regulator n=1 Tax=Sphingomonas aurantiaca TaxID=185949 RepID=UPI002FDF5328
MMSLNLLLVEDDAVFAQGLADELRGFDHAVTVAADGREALAAVDSVPFDAVVLDRMLPKVDGMSVLARLRGSNMTLPVIMLTALGRSVEKVEGLEAGADDYVVKPIAAAEAQRPVAGDGARAALDRGQQRHDPRGRHCRQPDQVPRLARRDRDRSRQAGIQAARRVRRQCRHRDDPRDADRTGLGL